MSQMATPWTMECVSTYPGIPLVDLHHPFPQGVRGWVVIEVPKEADVVGVVGNHGRPILGGPRGDQNVRAGVGPREEAQEAPKGPQQEVVRLVDSHGWLEASRDGCGCGFVWIGSSFVVGTCTMRLPMVDHGIRVSAHRK